MPDDDYDRDIFEETARSLLLSGNDVESLVRWLRDINEELAERQEQNRQQNR